MAVRNKAKRIRLFGLAALASAGVVSLVLIGSGREPTPPAGEAALGLGRQIYADYCAACHGETLQGQPDCQKRQANGRLPAPPHDASGHTWHHPDDLLFAMTKLGIEALAGPGYESDMSAFEDQLSDAEIRAVLAYIKSSWPPDIRARQEEISRRATAEN
jgi:mono/diheme cytochrome c family protein